MTTIQKIQYLRTERYEDLSKWEQEFIESLYDNVQEPDEEMTQNQKDKLEQIWQELGY